MFATLAQVPPITSKPGSLADPRQLQPEKAGIMSLRDHLIAAQQATGHNSFEPHHAPAPPHQIDPQISGPTSFGPVMPAPGLDSSQGSNKGRRELSTSKRAAQNRAAQRAFRQRKEQYINSLKEQVKGYQALSQDFDALSDENRVLREYIIQLQTRLEESNIERPTEPAGLHDSMLQRRQVLPQPPLQDPDEEVNALSPSYILQQAAAAAQEASNAASADIAAGGLGAGEKAEESPGEGDHNSNNP